MAAGPCPGLLMLPSRLLPIVNAATHTLRSGLPQPQFACVDVAPRRRARRTAAASPPRRTPPPRRSRALAFQNSPSARSCCRTAMQNAPQAQAVPLLQQLLGFTPHQLMGYFQFLHILYMLSHTTRRRSSASTVALLFYYCSGRKSRPPSRPLLTGSARRSGSQLKWFHTPSRSPRRN